MRTRHARSANFELARVFERKTPADWQLNTHISVKNRYVYFQVCKAASSTIKHHLQTIEFDGSHFRVQNPRNKYLSPHLSPYQLRPAQITEIMQDSSWKRVAFVRNPLTRLLSCYLHRIVAQPDSPSARHYRRSNRDTGTPSFRRFVEVVCQQSSLEMDSHWRVQSDEILDGLVELSFVGRYERLHSDLERLSQLLYGRAAFKAQELDEVNASPMQTGAEGRLSEYYTDDLVSMVVERFRRDFDRFGYPTSLPLGR